MQKWVQKNWPKKCHFWSKMSKKHVFFWSKFRAYTGKNAKKTPLFLQKNTKKWVFLKTGLQGALHGFWPKWVILSQKLINFLTLIFEIAPGFGRILVKKKCHFFVKTETAKNRFLIKETCWEKPCFSGFWKKVVHFLFTFWPILGQKPWRAPSKPVLQKSLFFDHFFSKMVIFGVPLTVRFWTIFGNFESKTGQKLFQKKSTLFWPKMGHFWLFLTHFWGHFLLIFAACAYLGMPLTAFPVSPKKCLSKSGLPQKVPILAFFGLFWPFLSYFLLTRFCKTCEFTLTFCCTKNCIFCVFAPKNTEKTCFFVFFGCFLPFFGQFWITTG